jgi:hypothetical protein
MGVPAYNGDLFSADALPGASVLEHARLSNAAFSRTLAALGHDPATGTGVDYSSLEVGHLGHIYEDLLSLHLSLADVDLTLYSTGSKEERFEPTRSGDEAGVRAGDLFWQTNTGGRKAGGCTTPDLLVEHLVKRAVLPALDRHLHDVQSLTGNDAAGAARRLFQFRVLDPACGSAHFLVSALHRMAERINRFLADNPLPEVRDELEQLRTATGVATARGSSMPTWQMSAAVAQPAGLADVAKQGLHHRQRDQFGVGNPWRDPDRRAPQHPFGCNLQHIIDPDVVRREGIQVSVHVTSCSSSGLATLILGTLHHIQRTPRRVDPLELII